MFNSIDYTKNKTVGTRKINEKKRCAKTPTKSVCGMEACISLPFISILSIQFFIVTEIIGKKLLIFKKMPKNSLFSI